MAIKISNNTIIDDDRKIVDAGTVTGESFTPTSATVPTTGIYLSGVNEIAVATNSTARMSIDSGGTANFNLSPTAPTPATGDNSTRLATTAFVKAQAYAPLFSPALAGNPTAPTPATGDNSTRLATTAFVKAQTQEYAPLAGFRNVIINGGFDVWQRTETYSGTDTGYRSADCWITSAANGTGAYYNISKQRSAISDDSGNGAYCRWEVAIAGSGYTRQSFETKIEDVRTLAGQEVTLSFRVRGSFSQINTIYLLQQFGSGGSSDFVYNLGSVPIISSSAWQTVEFTTTLADVAGKTIGDDSRLSLRFDLPPGVTGRMDIANVQLEPGPVATPFERRPIGVELALCQRYYLHFHPTFDSRFAPNGHGYMANTGFGRFFVPTPVTMRTAPSLTIGTDGAQVRCAGEVSSINVVGVIQLEQTGINLALDGLTFVGSTANHAAHLSLGQDASFSAEL